MNLMSFHLFLDMVYLGWNTLKSLPLFLEGEVIIIVDLALNSAWAWVCFNRINYCNATICPKCGYSFRKYPTNF